MKIMSSDAQSFRSVAAWLPNLSAWATAFAAVLFQTTTLGHGPARLARWPAMCQPIAPKPTNAIFGCDMDVMDRGAAANAQFRREVPGTAARIGGTGTLGTSGSS